jgi:hypothetical protein
MWGFEAMIAVDYFLYDNRTQSPWGRDWGIKAATGKLASRGDLKADFSRYCGAMPSQQGSLSGFGEAIGGFRSRISGGYLLCITLESRDLAGRPSWAVFGLWCPDPETLAEVVTADPIASARAVIGVETLPSVIGIQPAAIATAATRRRTPRRTVFRRFDPEASAREVLSLLLGSMRARAVLPNILGITASSRLPELAEAGFDRVYCHPTDDAAARILKQLLSGPELEIEDDVLPWPQTAPANWSPTRGSIVQPRLRSPMAWTLWLTVGVVVAVSVILIAYSPREPDYADPHAFPTRPESVTPAPVAMPTSSEIIVLDIEQRLQELKHLEPDELRHSKGYEVAQEPVLVVWEPERKKVLDAYATLLDIRQRMTDKGQVAYYYEDDGKGTEPTKKLGKIIALLKPHPLGSQECKTLRHAFAFEFENENSTLSRWCASLTRLEATVRSVQ